MSACDACLRRTALIGALAPHVERARREQRHLRELLALADEDLLAAIGGQRRAELQRAQAAFEPCVARQELERASLYAVCRHADGYPARLLEAADAPAMLHVAGDPGRLTALAHPARRRLRSSARAAPGPMASRWRAGSGAVSLPPA